MNIQISPEESEEYFFNALCNGLGYFGGYGMELDFDDKAYDKAAEKLKADPTLITWDKRSLPPPAFEDILMQMLHDGGSLDFKDLEGDGDLNRSITLHDIHEKVGNTPTRHLIDMAEGNDDADTADVILQTVLFGEIMLG